MSPAPCMEPLPCSIFPPRRRRWRRAAGFVAVGLFCSIVLWQDGPWWLAAAPLVVLLFYLIRAFRRRTWRLFGPHLFYDPGRLARRGRVTILRILFLGVLLCGLGWTYERQPNVLAVNTMSRVTQDYTFAFFVMQNMTIVLLTPIYVGSAIAEEKERRSLELLFTTSLRSSEIVLGILGGRLILLSSFTLSALPILCLMQVWGGVDMLLMLGNEINSLMLLGAVGGACILASALAPTVIWGVVSSYGLLFVPFFFCGLMAFLDVGSPFVLYDARAAGAAQLTVQGSLVPLGVGYFTILAVCAFLAIRLVRVESIAVLDAARPSARQLSSPPHYPFAALLQATFCTTQPSAPEELQLRWAPFPPLGENALMWKECYTGGRALLFTPFVCSFLLLFILYGIPLFVAETTRLDRKLDFLQFYYYAFLIFYAVGVMFRATASVAREREQCTLDMLLQIPEKRRAILWAKYYGALWKGWHWLVLVAANVLIGLALGYYSPRTAIWLLIAPWPLLFLATSVALFLSVVLATVLRARLSLTILLLGLFFIAKQGRFNPIPAMPNLPGLHDPFWLFPKNALEYWLLMIAAVGGWQLAYLCGATIIYYVSLWLFEPVRNHWRPWAHPGFRAARR
jgi:ABC-type transport system involved in multi-copper enzyme maturation permease subunit